MFRRTYLGLDICQEGLRAIAVQRRGRSTFLTGGQLLQFSEGVIQPSTRELNVLKPELYIESLREVLLPISKNEERVALSIPDAAGHTFLLEVDTPLKNRQQNIEILKWQLKETLPEGYRDFSLDYQVLSEQESGSKKVLVSVIDNKVLQQFETLMEMAGFNATLIDFHSFQLYNCYRSKTDLGDDFILVGVGGGNLIILGFQGKILDFFRVKSVAFDPEKVFREINRSLVTYRNEHSLTSRTKVYLHTDWPDQENLVEAVNAAFATQAHLLPGPLSQLKSSGQSISMSGSETSSMAAALGAAERLLEKVI